LTRFRGTTVMKTYQPSAATDAYMAGRNIFQVVQDRQATMKEQDRREAIAHRGWDILWAVCGGTAFSRIVASHLCLVILDPAVAIGSTTPPIVVDRSTKGASGDFELGHMQGLFARCYSGSIGRWALKLKHDAIREFVVLGNGCSKSPGLLLYRPSSVLEYCCSLQLREETIPGVWLEP
jgi:hypothetical protein